MTTKNDNNSTRSNAENRPSDGTAVVPDDSDDVPRRLGRRTFVKGLGATAAGGLGVKYGVQDADALALTTAALVGVAAGAAAGIAFGMTFGGPDESQVADSIEWNNHVDEFTRTREDELMLAETIASLKRDVQLVENKAREQAIFRIYEQGVDSGTEADATAAAEDAINNTYATVERAMLSSYQQRYKRAKNIHLGFGGDPGAHFGSVTQMTTRSSMDDAGYTPALYFTNEFTRTVNLLDGSTFDIQGIYEDRGSNYAMLDPVRWQNTDPSGVHYDQVFINKPDPSNYSTVDSSDALDINDNEAKVLDVSNWGSLLSDLYAAHSALISEVSSMVSSYYQPAADGEIDLYEAVGPSHLTDTAQTATDYEEASLALRAMGYPLSEQVVTIAVPTEDGGTQELTGRLSWTAHQGNSLDVGVKHGPSNIPGSIFAAVNIPDGIGSLNSTNTTNTTSTTDTGPGAEIIELIDEFEILEAGGADGVTFKDRSLAEADATSNEEINKIYKENYDANKEATETVHDTATGGGGGLSWSGFTSMEKGIALVAGGLGAWALLGDD